MLKAAALMAERLRIMKRTQQQALERGLAVGDPSDLLVGEIFEAGDQAALDAYEKALLQVTGAVPLPFEVAG